MKTERRVFSLRVCYYRSSDITTQQCWQCPFLLAQLLLSLRIMLTRARMCINGAVEDRNTA
jgi:hypothetical protein